MIQKTREKIKEFLHALRRELFLVLVIVLLAFASFGLGRLSVLMGEKGRLEVVYPEQQASATESATPQKNKPMGMYVASISGAKYHLLSCPGAGAIKEENKIFFDTREAAEQAGYTPAANCQF